MSTGFKKFKVSKCSGKKGRTVSLVRKKGEGRSRANRSRFVSTITILYIYIERELWALIYLYI